jgi:MATE family multidrug resistance protein
MVPLAGLVDTAFLGHLQDIRYLAGVILASILFDYLYRVLKFLRTSTTALTAQACGANDPGGVLLAGIRSAVVALIIGLGILALQYPIKSIGFTLLSGSATVELSGVEYFNGRIWGAPAVLLNFVIIGWFLGQERNGWVFWLSLMGNFSNVGLDYLMINRWGWASYGAGLATALSQYLALGVGIVGICSFRPWLHFASIRSQLKDWAGLQEAVILKSNILVRFVLLISTFAIFTNLSSLLGTEILAQNGLLLQIALLSQFTVQGLGMTMQALVGNLKSRGHLEQLGPLLGVSILCTLLIALAFALSALLFPSQVFGWLTNHQEVSQGLIDYSFWLLPLLEITAFAFMLEGYFIGLKQTEILRNAVVLAFGVGFLPVAGLAWYGHSNHLLWLSLIAYMVILAVYLGWQWWQGYSPQKLAQLASRTT